MEATVEQRLEALEKAIHALAEEAWDIVVNLGDRATTPYWNIPAGLAEADRACSFALRIEREEAANA